MRLVVALLGFALLAGGGAAIAGTGAFSPKQEREAFLDDAAKELGVEPSALSAALKNAFKKRVDAAVAAGRVSKAEGDRIKARIDAGDVPLFFGPRFGGRLQRDAFRDHGFGFGRRHGPNLAAAASYLGLSEAKLRDAVAGGKSLAQVAKDRAKSVDGLVQAMLADKISRLDEAVRDGRLTKEERDDLVAGLKERVTDFVNGRFPSHRPPELRERRGAALFFPVR